MTSSPLPPATRPPPHCSPLRLWPTSPLPSPLTPAGGLQHAGAGQAAIGLPALPVQRRGHAHRGGCAGRALLLDRARRGRTAVPAAAAAGPGEGLGQEALPTAPPPIPATWPACARTEVQALRIERAALRELVAGQPALRSRALLALAARLGALAPLRRPPRQPLEPRRRHATHQNRAGLVRHPGAAAAGLGTGRARRPAAAQRHLPGPVHHDGAAVAVLAGR